MIFPVKYVTPTRFGSVLTFFGEGTVHLLETALILEGSLPRVRVPVLPSTYHQLLCGHTVRTVPYSMIVEHRPRTLLRWEHVMLFRWPAGSGWKTHAVGFRLRGKIRDADFASQLAERMSVARSFEGGPHHG